MRVFVTGASGFIGSSVVPELLAHGHHVLGLARSEASAEAIRRAGAEVLRGDLEDHTSLRAGAAESEAVVHLGFVHDFARLGEGMAIDRRAVLALGEALAGSQKPLVVASGVAALRPGRVVRESDLPDTTDAVYGRHETGVLALRFAERGVRTALLRLPPTVHGPGDHGFVPMLIAAARQKGASRYVGDGTGRWPATHVEDVARLVRLALEKAPAGTVLHAVAEEGVPTKAIAEGIARHLGVPTASVAAAEAATELGFVGAVFAMDCPASSAATRELLGWEPSAPGLLADLDAGHYFGR